MTFVSHPKQNNSGRPLNWRPYRLITLIIFGLVTLQLVLANYLSTLGTQLASLNSQIDDLNRQNSDMESRVTAKMALTNLASQAQSLGLAKPTKMVFINTPSSVALRPL